MPKAFLFLHSLEDAEFAVRSLGLPLELVPRDPIHAEQKIQVTHLDHLEKAYRQLCDNNTSREFTALRL